MSDRKPPQRKSRSRKLKVTNSEPPTRDELALAAMRQTMLEQGVVLILENYAKRLHCSVTTIYRRHRACIDKGLIPGVEDPSVSDPRFIEAQQRKQIVLNAAEVLAPRGTMLDPLTIAKHLGWGFYLARRVVFDLKAENRWDWVDPPKPTTRKQIEEDPAAIPKPAPPRTSKPIALEPPEHPRYRHGPDDPALVLAQRAFDVAGYVAEWKSRKRRSQRARTS